MDLREKIREQVITLLIRSELSVKRIFSKKLFHERITDLVRFSYTSRKKRALLYLCKYCDENTQLEILLKVRKTLLYQDDALFSYIQTNIISQFPDNIKMHYYKHELEHSPDYFRSQWSRNKYIILLDEMFLIRSPRVAESLYSIALKEYKTILLKDTDSMFHFTKGWNFTRKYYCVYGPANSYYFIHILGKLFLIEKFKEKDRDELFEMAERLVKAFISCLQQLKYFGVISGYFESVLTGHLTDFLENVKDSNYFEQLSKLHKEYVSMIT